MCIKLLGSLLFVITECISSALGLLLKYILSCCVFIFTFGRSSFYDTIFYLGRNNNVVIGKHLDWLCNKT